ncbi:MAG: hypothetical protein Q9167_007844 [Letrouitia subvulpina]
MVGLATDPTDCKDLDMNDFRHIADFFLSYNFTPTPATQQSISTKVKGVKINCLGDQKMFNSPCFEELEISSTDPIFFNHDTSDIANRIGLPIYTRRCPPNPRWANDQDNKIFGSDLPFKNQYATYLHLCCDPNAKFDPQSGVSSWGWVSKRWLNDVGTIIVVRQDKKPLSPLHVEALCKYCQYEINPLFSHSEETYALEESMSKDAVLAMICRPTFIIHWNKLLERKSKEGEDTSAPYPFDGIEP